jgi:AraC-like DNA-binding protein
MEIIEPVLYIGISQTFFAALLIATKKPATTPNRLMATFMSMLFFDLIFAVVKINFLTFYSFPFIAFTYGPIMFLYIHYMIHPEEKFNFLNLLHFIPFVSFLVVSFVFRSDHVFTDITGFFLADRFISLRIVYGVSFFLSITVYSVLAFILISRYQRELKNRISYTSGVITLNWLKIISISFYATYIIFFILGGLNIFVNFLPFDPYYTIFVFVAIFSFLYSFYVIKQPALLNEMVYDESYSNSADDSTYEGDQSSTKYSRSGLKENEAATVLKNLLAFMEKQKPYLDRDLTIHRLASLTGIQKHYITQVLNENYNRNFFTFINEYRVNEVIERMKDPANSNFTILGIAYDSGFNSKSTFNTIFKNMTGQTPSDYKKKLDAGLIQGS